MIQLLLCVCSPIHQKAQLGSSSVNWSCRLREWGSAVAHGTRTGCVPCPFVPLTGQKGSAHSSSWTRCAHKSLAELRPARSWRWELCSCSPWVCSQAGRGAAVSTIQGQELGRGSCASACSSSQGWREGQRDGECPVLVCAHMPRPHWEQAPARALREVSRALAQDVQGQLRETQSPRPLRAWHRYLPMLTLKDDHSKPYWP